MKREITVITIGSVLVALCFSAQGAAAGKDTEDRISLIGSRVKRSHALSLPISVNDF